MTATPLKYRVAQLERAKKFLWAIVLVTLPVTTFRFLPTPLGRSVVAPLALLPLALLVPLLLISFFRSGKLPLPPNIRPLLALVLIALFTSLFAFLNPPLTLRGVSLADRVLRGWSSLLLGLAFFFAAFWMNRSKGDLSYSLRWIYLGLGATLIWSFIQAAAINTSMISRAVVNQIQLLFSTRPLLPRRISGFAYEPAWLADQLVIFYLPWMVASLIAFRPLFRIKWLELLLFLFSSLALVFTYSRGGLAIAAICLVVVFLLSGRSAWQSIRSRVDFPWRTQTKRAVPVVLLQIGLLVLIVLAAIGLTNFLVGYGYFARILEFRTAESLLDYVIDIGAGPRLTYALAGYRIFENAPLTGVGLGASGLSLMKYYPDWSASLAEVARHLSPDSNLIPNIKNLYIRLLAEAGLPGFWAYVVFLLSFVAMIRRLHASGDRDFRFVAIAGTFAWLAASIRNLTQDSFTFPVMWIILGMLVGQYSLQTNSRDLERKS